jgi:hypothetical protein
VLEDKWQGTPIHSIAEKGYSRKLNFRCMEFSETELPISLILGNPCLR